MIQVKENTCITSVLSAVKGPGLSGSMIYFKTEQLNAKGI